MSYTFTWGPGPSEVIVTGTFDDWSKSLPLIKTSTGEFELTVPLKDDKKILYKYVVDGEWVISPNATVETENGIANNVLYPKDLVSASGAQTVVPESGLPVAAAGTAKTTVLPSSEGQQKTMGEPGVVIPQNAASIDAFNTVSTVDPKSLNEPEDEKKISTSGPKSSSASKKKKKVKKSKKKVKKNGAAAAVSSKEASPAPESVTTTTTNENGDATTTDASEVPSDIPAVVATEPVKELEPVAEPASEPAAVPVSEPVSEPAAAPVAEPVTAEHKTLDPAVTSEPEPIPAVSSSKTEPVPKDEIVGVEEVTPEEVQKLGDDEQIVAVEEVVDSSAKHDSIEPVKDTKKTTKPVSKKEPVKEEKKKKGFFSKLKKVFS